MKEIRRVLATIGLLVATTAGQAMAEEPSKNWVLDRAEKQYETWVVSGDNLIANGGFESDEDNNHLPDGWNRQAGKEGEPRYDKTGDHAHGGKAACWMAPEGTFGQSLAGSKLKPDTTYRYSAWIKAAEQPERIILSIAYYPGNPPEGGVSYNLKEAKGTEHIIYDLKEQPVSREWRECVRFTTTPSFPIQTLDLGFWPIGEMSYRLWVDDVSFVEVRQTSEK